MDTTCEVQATDEPATRQRTLDDALDAAPLSAIQIATFVLCGIVMMIDGYDLVAMPFAVPYVIAEWGWEASRFGIALSAVLIGLAIGALFVAPFGDRFGRRPLILIAVALVGLATVGTATATSIPEFTVWRLLTGLALGAGLANVPAIVSELAPKRQRARILTFVTCGIAIGGGAAGFIVPLLVAGGGWRMIFIGPGAVTIGIAVLLFFLLPESPKFLLVRGEKERLTELTRRLGLPNASWPVPTTDAKPSRIPLLAPFGKAHRFASFVFMGLYAVNALILYMLVSWAPTLLAQSEFPLERTSQLASLIQIGGLVSGPALSWFLDRGKAAPAMAATYFVIGAALLGFSVVAPSVLGWGALLLAAGGGVSGTHLAIMALGATFYPPHMLSSALGLGVAVARVGAIAGPMIGSALLANGATPPVFLASMVIPVAVCSCLAFLIPRVRARRV